MQDPPHGDCREFAIRWLDRDTGLRGLTIVDAAHVEEARRGFERDNAGRIVLRIEEINEDDKDGPSQEALEAEDAALR